MRDARLHAILLLLVAAAWVLLFKLNAVLFSRFEVTPYVSWIFLPASIRMLAVLWLGWVGAAGLFFGALVTNGALIQQDPAAALVLSALSALPSLVAARAVTRILRVPSDLNGLRPFHLLAFGAAGAAASVVAHTVYFLLDGNPSTSPPAAIPMFVGDAVGTVLVLIGISATLRWFTRPR